MLSTPSSPRPALAGRLALGAAFAFAGACGVDIPRVDSGGPILPPPPPFVDAGPVGPDLDGDGLCNATEAFPSVATDILDPDTDGDGLQDRIEAELSFSPTRADSPDRDQIVVLRGAPGETVRHNFQFLLRGDGQDVVGVYETLAIPEDEEVSDTFFLGVRAVAASPADHAFEVVAEEGRFRAVLGSTQLLWEVTFRVPEDAAERTCARPLPYRLLVIQADGAIRARRTFVLAVTPPGEETDLTTATWCAYPECI